MATMTHVEALQAIGYNPEVFWRCEVFSSGFHNGATCNPSDPHAGWDCRWMIRVEIPLADATEAKRERDSWKFMPNDIGRKRGDKCLKPTTASGRPSRRSM